jgi:hypothetical protein
MEVVLHVLFACIVTYINVKKRIILCSNVYEPLSHLRDGGGCTLVGRNTLLKKRLCETEFCWEALSCCLE